MEPILHNQFKIKSNRWFPPNKKWTNRNLSLTKSEEKRLKTCTDPRAAVEAGGLCRTSRKPAFILDSGFGSPPLTFCLLLFCLVGCWRIVSVLLLESQHQHRRSTRSARRLLTRRLSARRPAAKPNLSCCEAAAAGIILMARREAKSLWPLSSAWSCWSSLIEFWKEFMMRDGNLLTLLLCRVESCEFLSCCMCRSFRKLLQRLWNESSADGDNFLEGSWCWSDVN